MTLRPILAACALVLAVGMPAAEPLAATGQPRPEQQDEFVPISELPPQEQLPAQPLVVAAYAFAWLALGGYVVSVARRLTAVHKEIERLQADSGRRAERP